jgi:hypothetical protein
MSAPQPPQLEREIDVLRQAVQKIENSLPPDWSISAIEELLLSPRLRADAMLELLTPDGQRVQFIAEIKRSIATRDLPTIVDQLDQAAQDLGPEVLPLVVARYLAPPSREWLVERGVSYADATGNLRLLSEVPAMFLRDVGASKDPWRGPGRPRGTLKGEPSARVVRTLVDFAPPLTVPELIKRSGASAGATYRVVEFLEEQGLLTRTSRGPIETVAWAKVLTAWAKDYGFMPSNPVRSYLQPRGLEAVVAGLRRVRSRYAVTGSLAAQEWAPYAPPRAAMIYADNPDDVAQELSLREVETGANVLIAAPVTDVVFARSWSYDGLTIVAPSQAVVDLLTGPGRAPAEAEALLKWMETHVEQWRR